MVTTFIKHGLPQFQAQISNLQALTVSVGPLFYAIQLVLIMIFYE